MATELKRDQEGHYYQWGEAGKKYYFQAGDQEDRAHAYEAAERQGRAIQRTMGDAQSP